MTHLLRTDKLVKAYRKRRVVNGVSIEVGAGEIVGLLGPNGAGKTTTFNIVVGVVRPDAGFVFFQDQAVRAFPSVRLRMPEAQTEELRVPCSDGEDRRVQQNLVVVR